MPFAANEASASIDLAALDAITDAVEAGAGLPEVVRASARALNASLAVGDRAGAILAVAARSPADERSLTSGADGVDELELRVADMPVGKLLVRARGDLAPALLRLVTTLIASEVERVRMPERASEEAVAGFLRAILNGEFGDRDELLMRAREVTVDLDGGASIVVAHARPQVPVQEGWRARVRAAAERGARGAAPGAVAALSDRETVSGVEVLVLVPSADEAVARRAAEGVFRELQSSLSGHAVTVGHSRPTTDALELSRAANEALLAANVAEGNDDRPLLAFEETGAYRLLLSTMSENPDELQRFYSETVEPLVAYDEQYETELVRTVAAFLEADGNVAGTAQRLFTHRHTIRYRLERVRELSGLDVGSSDGREKLSLGLKAMRVLGIATAAGPATESGAEAGRVPGSTRKRP
jgi:sugar diacid utilization regulator